MNSKTLNLITCYFCKHEIDDDEGYLVGNRTICVFCMDHKD